MLSRTFTFEGERTGEAGGPGHTVRGRFYFEPRRFRTIMVRERRRVYIETPPMVIGNVWWCYNNGEDMDGTLVFLAEATSRFSVDKTSLYPLYNGLCIGDRASRLLQQGKITAPEAVWLTAWLAVPKFDYPAAFTGVNKRKWPTLNEYLQRHYTTHPFRIRNVEWKEIKP